MPETVYVVKKKEHAVDLQLLVWGCLEYSWKFLSLPARHTETSSLVTSVSVNLCCCHPLFILDDWLADRTFNLFIFYTTSLPIEYKNDLTGAFWLSLWLTHFQPKSHLEHWKWPQYLRVVCLGFLVKSQGSLSSLRVTETCFVHTARSCGWKQQFFCIRQRVSYSILHN